MQRKSRGASLNGFQEISEHGPGRGGLPPRNHVSSTLDSLISEATVRRDHVPASNLLSVVGSFSELRVVPRGPVDLRGELHRQDPGLSRDKVDDGISISRIDHNLKISLIVEELVVGDHGLLTEGVRRSSAFDPLDRNSMDGRLDVSAVEVGRNVVINASRQNRNVEASRDGSITQHIDKRMRVASNTHGFLGMANIDEDVIRINVAVNIVLVGIIEAEETVRLIVLSQRSTKVVVVASRGVTDEETAEVLLRISVRL